MIVSNDCRTPASPNSTTPPRRHSGDHWFEMTATLSTQEMETFDQWVDQSLSRLTESLRDFSSPKARGESYRS